MDLQFVGAADISSTWRRAKAFADAPLQTLPQQVSEAETQTNISALQVSELLDKKEGTEPRNARVPPARVDGLQYAYPGPHYDEAALAQFLVESQDNVIQALRQNCKSTAFAHYEPNWSERRDSVALLLTLTPPFAMEGEWHATALSWNTTGTTIAIGYGRVDTTAWCSSKGYTCVWNIQRGDVDSRTPDATIECDSYVTALAFHPTQPALLAGGAYTGELLLWDTSDGAKVPVTSLGSAIAPREPIAELRWLQNLRETRESHRFVLCSASQDGKIMFWSPTNKLQEPLSGYEVQNKKRNLVGVQSMAFVKAGVSKGATGGTRVPGVENVMLLGLESGDVFRTKPGISVADTVGKAQTREGLAVLEVDHFSPHRGPVQSVDCSPFFRNLLLTCSSDGCLNLYSTLERQPLLTLEPSTETRHFLYGAAFSPVRAGVLACVSRSSQLHIYDLAQSRTKPAVSVDAGVDGIPVISLAFNEASVSLLATGDMRGNVRVWELPTALTHPSELERAAVRASEGAAAAAAAAATASPDGGEAKRGGAQGEQESGTNPVRQLLGFSL